MIIQLRGRQREGGELRGVERGGRGGRALAVTLGFPSRSPPIQVANLMGVHVSGSPRPQTYMHQTHTYFSNLICLCQSPCPRTNEGALSPDPGLTCGMVGGGGGWGVRHLIRKR